MDILLFVKLIGSLAVVFGSGAAGQMWSARYRARVWHLRELQGAIRRLETELRYATVPLPAAMRSANDSISGPVSALFQHMSRRLAEAGGRGESAEAAWLASVEAAGPELALTAEDLKLLRSLGDSLGACDVDSQLQQFGLCRELLARQEEEAQATRLQNERLWPAVGLSVGMMVVIWLA